MRSQEQTAMNSVKSDDSRPREGDPLGVLCAAANMLLTTSLVTIDHDAITRLAEQWASAPWPEKAGLDALHFNDGTERTVNWILLLDALNFCFWGEPGQPRWRVEWRGETLDGYAALAAALSRAVEEGLPLWDARYLAGMTPQGLGHILRPVADAPEIPLFTTRVSNVREAGAVLLKHYDGQFTHAVERAKGNAVALARLLADDFPSFRDISVWRGEPLAFLKRAQICVADLHASFNGERWGAFHNLDQLTAFADYKLPQLLRATGALNYCEALARPVDQYALIPAGSEEEIAIRAATVCAVELLRRALRAKGIERTASAIDYRLWDASQRLGPGVKPYHRTRTIYY
jgi:hypothetical protein